MSICSHPRSASCGSRKGLERFLYILLISVVIFNIVLWSPVKAYALNLVPQTYTLVDGKHEIIPVAYSSIMSNYQHYPKIILHYEETFSYYGFDCNELIIVCPKLVTESAPSIYPNINPDTTNNYSADLHLYSSSDLLCDENGDTIEGSYAVLSVTNRDFTRPGTIPRDISVTRYSPYATYDYNYVGLFYGYSSGSGNNNNYYAMLPTTDKFWGYYRSSTISGSSNKNYYAYCVNDPLPCQVLSGAGFLAPYRVFVYPRVNGWLIFLGPAFSIFHDVQSIDFEGDNSFQSSITEDECGCSNCCDCDCGFYTEQLKEELIDYFETNMVTREMFEEFMQNTGAAYLNDQQSEIDSQLSDTSIDQDISDYKDDQEGLFDDLNSYVSDIDSFGNNLTISPEVSAAAGVINNMFGSIPSSVIIAMSFCLVVLVLVKVIGR